MSKQEEKRPVSDPIWWRYRIDRAIQMHEPHRMMFECSREHWDEVQANHKKLLGEIIKENTSILDCGCGYGRLLEVLPEHWRGGYRGIDISPDLIAIARKRHPERWFNVMDLLDLNKEPVSIYFDYAVVSAVMPMIVGHRGGEVWAKMKANIRLWAEKILYLDYDGKTGKAVIDEYE